MVHQRVTRIDHCTAPGITHGIISGLTVIPSRQHAVDMLRRYAIAHPVYQSRQSDVVSLSFISNYQPLGYLHLILGWSACTEIKTHQRIREAV
ncbi:hypothetical protein SS14_23215 [Enterobacter bugandensis]|nr:hypothetical protein SS14_23215 [Enterobacter bugandensis]